MHRMTDALPVGYKWILKERQISASADPVPNFGSSSCVHSGRYDTPYAHVYVLNSHCLSQSQVDNSVML